MIFCLELLVLIIGTIISIVLQQKRSRYSNAFSMAFLIFFAVLMITTAGLRTSYGRDLSNYQYIYERTATWQQTINYPLEKGYLLLNFIFNQFRVKFGLFVFAIAVLTLGLRVFTIKKLSVYPLLSLVTYFMLYFVSQEMEQFRGALAGVIFLYGSMYLLDNKKFRFLSLAVVSISLHVSALTTALMIFWDKIKLTIKNLCIILLIAFGIGAIDFVQVATVVGKLLNSPHLIGKLSLYSNDEISFTMTLIIRISLLLSFVFLVYNENIKRHRLLAFGYLLSIVILIAFRSLPIFALRAAGMFKPFEIFLIPEIIGQVTNWNRFNTVKRAWCILSIGLVLFYCLHSFRNLLLAPEYFNYKLLGI